MVGSVTRGVSLALVLMIALLVGGLAWARLVKDVNPEAVLGLMPWHPSALLEVAEKSRASGTATPEDIAAQGRQILPLAPLVEAPLVYAGFDRAARGDLAGAEEAFRAAIKRQPRNRPALSRLAAIAIAENNHELSLQLLDQLSRVDPGNGKLYAELAASLASHEAGAAILERELGKTSPLALAAVETLIPTTPDIGMALRFAKYDPRFQHRIVDRLVREQGLEPAFIAWLYFLPPLEATGFGWPYDPAFVGSDAPPPFNWQLLSDAELLQEGGLLVRYGGRGSQVFARQTMLLGPGSYRFSAQMDGDLSGKGGQLVWQMQCLPDKRVIASEHSFSASELLSTQSMVFAVPSTGCRVQALSLEGRPGPLAARVRATVRHVSIRAIGTGEP